AARSPPGAPRPSPAPPGRPRGGRAQNAGMVRTRPGSSRARAPCSRSRSSPRAPRAAASSRAWKRWESSAAALIVKVTAERRSIEARPLRTSATIRSTRLSVFPVPAAASTSRVVSSSSRIARPLASSGSGAEHPPSLLFMDLPEGAERRQRRGGELALRARRGVRDSSADGLVVAEGAVVGIDGVREGAGREEIHQTVEDLPCLLPIERHAEPLAFAAPPREEVAGVGHDGLEAGAAEEDLEGERVERVLDPAAAVQAAGFREAERGPGLVVPDLERAVRSLVD